MKKATIILFSLLCHLVTSASNYPISGTVVNENNQPLEFTNISIMVDSIYLTGCTTDERGFFKIEVPKVANGVNISCVGYYSKRIKINDSTTDIGKIQLTTEATVLAEVVVKAPLIRREADRIILNIAANPLTVGKNAKDILRTSPGVWAKGVRSERDTLRVTVDNNSHVRYDLSRQILSEQKAYGTLGSVERERYESARDKYLKTCSNQMREINNLFMDSINMQVADYMKDNKLTSNHIFLLIGVDGNILNVELSINNELIDMINNREIIKYLKRVYTVRFPKIDNSDIKSIGFRFHLNEAIENRIRFMQKL